MADSLKSAAEHGTNPPGLNSGAGKNGGVLSSAGDYGVITPVHYHPVPSQAGAQVFTAMEGSTPPPPTTQIPSPTSRTGAPVKSALEHV